jgi:hypothetical protein
VRRPYELRRSRTVEEKSRGRTGTLPGGRIGWNSGEDRAEDAGVERGVDCSECPGGWAEKIEEPAGESSECSSCCCIHFNSQDAEQYASEGSSTAPLQYRHSSSSHWSLSQFSFSTVIVYWK